tara:strand:- start:203 stop:880 length:678 start_codon:yes stop_codon:yes gene_type:complete
MFGWIYCKKKLIEDKKILDLFDGLINYLIIGIIVGGRVGYILIYNLDYYLANISEILMIWKGGMSFHGGLVGIVVSTFIYSKKNSVNAFIFLDLVAIVAPIGIFLGRISNFINSELYGKESDIFWSVKFLAVDEIYRHPSQIYEAIFEGIVLFLILNYLYRKKVLINPGVISSIFLILYSVFRIIIEYFREPDIQLGYLIFNLTMGQIVSIIFLIFGIYLFFKKK